MTMKGTMTMTVPDSEPLEYAKGIATALVSHPRVVRNRDRDVPKDKLIADLSRLNLATLHMLYSAIHSGDA